MLTVSKLTTIKILISVVVSAAHLTTKVLMNTTIAIRVVTNKVCFVTNAVRVVTNRVCVVRNEVRVVTNGVRVVTTAYLAHLAEIPLLPPADWGCKRSQLANSYLNQGGFHCD
jgi:hypothetical protein